MEGFRPNNHMMMQQPTYRTATIDILMRALKYFIEGLAVAVAAVVIPSRKLNFREVLTLGLTAAATFAVLDTLAPDVAKGARQGAGLAIGASTVGFGGINIGNTGVPAL